MRAIPRPAAAVIPEPIAYIQAVAVKKLVVGIETGIMYTSISTLDATAQEDDDSTSTPFADARSSRQSRRLRNSSGSTRRVASTSRSRSTSPARQRRPAVSEEECGVPLQQMDAGGCGDEEKEEEQCVVSNAEDGESGFDHEDDGVRVVAVEEGTEEVEFTLNESLLKGDVIHCTWPLLFRFMLAMLAVVVLVGIITLVIVFYSDITRFFTSIVMAIQKTGVWGYLVMACLIFVTTFPPIPGYGYLVMSCGFIWDLKGFFPAYIGAVLGGYSCFLVARYFFRDWVMRKVSNYPRFQAIERAISGEGLYLVFLLRLAPYPYPLFTVLFSASSVPFSVFAIATAVAQCKILLYVYIGSTLKNAADVVDGMPSAWTYVFVTVAIVITVGLSIYVYIKARRVLAKYQTQLDEENAAAAAAVAQDLSEDENGTEPTVIPNNHNHNNSYNNPTITATQHTASNT
eukprot:TRINITY_DN6056_c0_g1_i1.p1 TRINITY_DN6056_c0_g1~~TRINITY_DN6056_c0_g1_i1.p1  ORF type:complete len:458 (-),score=49.96 TRINITY_DN6056_c0_g1_i1:262-1635(-)